MGEEQVQRADDVVLDGVDADDVVEGLAGADFVATDVWVSLGEPKEIWDERIRLLKPYQVNAELMAKANDGAIFLHCLPAYRGNEVTADVIDGPASVVFDEAENRLHAQKALMAWLLVESGLADEQTAHLVRKGERG